MAQDRSRRWATPSIFPEAGYIAFFNMPSVVTAGGVFAKGFNHFNQDIIRYSFFDLPGHDDDTVPRYDSWDNIMKNMKRACYARQSEGWNQPHWKETVARKRPIQSLSPFIRKVTPKDCVSADLKPGAAGNSRQRLPINRGWPRCSLVGKMAAADMCICLGQVWTYVVN